MAMFITHCHTFKVSTALYIRKRFYQTLGTHTYLLNIKGKTILENLQHYLQQLYELQSYKLNVLNQCILNKQILPNIILSFSYLNY